MHTYIYIHSPYQTALSSSTIFINQCGFAENMGGAIHQKLVSAKMSTPPQALIPKTVGDCFASILIHYGLTERDCDHIISDSHLRKFARSNCGRWKILAPELKVKNIEVSDVERDYKEEKEKRVGFFMRWKQSAGTSATYRSLILALLEIGERQDAESLCKLMKDPGGECSSCEGVAYRTLAHRFCTSTHETGPAIFVLDNLDCMLVNLI